MSEAPPLDQGRWATGPDVLWRIRFCLLYGDIAWPRFGADKTYRATPPLDLTLPPHRTRDKIPALPVPPATHIAVAELGGQRCP